MTYNIAIVKEEIIAYLESKEYKLVKDALLFLSEKDELEEQELHNITNFLSHFAYNQVCQLIEKLVKIYQDTKKINQN